MWKTSQKKLAWGPRAPKVSFSLALLCMVAPGGTPRGTQFDKHYTYTITYSPAPKIYMK